MDLGPCPKLHLEKVKSVFEADRVKNSNDPRFQAFEQEYQNNLYAFVEDCDRKIRASQRRLEKTPEENAKGVNLVSMREGRMNCQSLSFADRVNGLFGIG